MERQSQFRCRYCGNTQVSIIHTKGIVSKNRRCKYCGKTNYSKKKRKLG